MGLKDTVKQKYGEAAKGVLAGSGSCCCCGPKLPSGIAQSARTSNEDRLLSMKENWI